MKKKILALMMALMCTAFTATACGNNNDEKTTIEDAGETEEVEEESEEAEDAEEESEEAEEETEETEEEESEETEEEANEENGGYDAKAIAEAFPIDNMRMTVSSEGQVVDVYVCGSNFMVETESQGYLVEMYYYEGVMYSHTSGQGIDQWVKTTEGVEDIGDELQEMGANGWKEENIGEVEYIETVEEDGTTYDVVRVEEFRDGEFYQELLFYINVETGLTERTESETSGSLIVIYYEPCEVFELPAAAATATEI